MDMYKRSLCIIVVRGASQSGYIRADTPRDQLVKAILTAYRKPVRMHRSIL